MPYYADRIKETSTSSGTGSVSMGGAVTGFRAFSAAFITGQTVYYEIEGGTAGEWETGIGTLTSGSPWTLSRDTVLSSSAGGTTKTSFTAGTQTVYCTVPAAFFNATDSAAADIRALAMMLSEAKGDRISMPSGIFDPLADTSDVGTITNGDTSTAGKIVPTSLAGTTGTWGQSSAGGRRIENIDGQSLGLRFTAPASQPITSVQVNVSTIVTSGTWEARLYTNNAGSPGTQVGSSSGSVSISATGNKTFTFGTPPSITNGTDYWIVITPTTGSPDATFDTCADQASYQSGRNNTITSITNNLPSTEDWRMQINYGTGVNNLTLISNAFTAASQPSRGRLVLQAKPIDSITINTDLIGYISRDGGTTFTAFTLASETTLADGTILYVHDGLDISGQPSGTSMKWKVVTANTKNVEINGVGLRWAA